MNKMILLATLVASTGLLALPAFAQDATAGASARAAANIDSSSLANGATQATDSVGSTLHKTGESAHKASHMLRRHARNAMQKTEAAGNAATGTHVSAGAKAKANANVTGVKLDAKANTQIDGSADH